MSVQLQLLMIYSNPLLSMKGARFQGGAIIAKTPLHVGSATQFPCVSWTMPIVECSYLYPPSWPEVNLPARTHGLKKGFRTCFNKAGDWPEEWNPSEFHLVSLGRNFPGFPAWQSPGGRMYRKAQGPQSLQVRSPASLSPLLTSLSKWTLDLKFCWGGKLNTLLRPTEMTAGISERWRIFLQRRKEQLTQSPYWGGKVSILKRMNDQRKELPLLCNSNVTNDKIFLSPSHA